MMFRVLGMRCSEHRRIVVSFDSLVLGIKLGFDAHIARIALSHHLELVKHTVLVLLSLATNVLWRHFAPVARVVYHIACADADIARIIKRRAPQKPDTVDAVPPNRLQ